MKRWTWLIPMILGAALFAEGLSEEAAGAPDRTEPMTLEVNTLKLVTPTGFTAIALAEFIGNDPVIHPGVDLEYEVLENSSLLASKILNGEADIFVAPTNLGATLYNKGEDLVFLGNMIGGILYIVTSEELSRWEDLRGREISMLGRGLSPDIITRYLLKENGLDPEKDVTLNYVQTSSELAPAFIAGKAAVSMMPEPALSTVLAKKKDTRIMVDLQEEWSLLNGTNGGYPQAGLFMKGSLARDNPEFVEALTVELAASLDRINADPVAAGNLAASFLAAPPAPIIAQSIPRGNLKWTAAAEIRPELDAYLKVLYDADPKNTGGKLPDRGFYYGN